VRECIQREVKTTTRRRRRRTRDKVSLFATWFPMLAPKTKKANIVKEVDWSRSEEEEEVEEEEEEEGRRKRRRTQVYSKQL
jgi:hypothetical protein